MNPTLKTRRVRRTTPDKQPNVGCLIKYTPSVHTQSRASSICTDEAIINYAANQPLVVVSEKIDENGCIRALKVRESVELP